MIPPEIQAHKRHTAKSATLRLPAGITTDGKDLYVIEQGNHRIRKID